ncbi:alpha-1,4-glucan--maltose-1-phosphate maltosyltransferase [Kitasatospora kifunensis]|uniref:Alpha-1,4-glucan:maltose-1-phosphate maltosyltransferase n=1 Tax=Kitasatospora kifunensis TaxID=58351 RepID=A0A7W7R1G0_KITKI|nr:alpha-1,4-glucan--maltose-1-phosphate maltosyltransferase [Kitasatospora kifunensis]MBB4923494.1 starch synthase (maltosyl-transferring) [Kitasatospora kifunensis]
MHGETRNQSALVSEGLEPLLFERSESLAPPVPIPAIAERGAARAPRTAEAPATKSTQRRTSGSTGAPRATTTRATTPRSSAPRPARRAKDGDPLIGRIPVLDLAPLVDGGRRPARAVVGETFQVTATVFREGHDAVNANVVLRDPRGRSGPWLPMRELAPGTDRWGAEVTPTAEGRWSYTVEAWSDPVASWRHTATVKVPAGQDVELTLEEGALLLERAAAAIPKRAGRAEVLKAVDALRDLALPPLSRLAAALAPAVTEPLLRHPLRELVTAATPLPLQVERQRALYGSWYEFFPRSEGATLDPPRSGTFRTAAKRLPAIAAMGFDVLYLPPIHPIGLAYRKGPNNTLTPGPHDVGSPWAIGSPEGGHDAIHPDLGTIEDFDAFVAEAAGLGIEIALDFALQASPDHPWVNKHPQWFSHRLDGTIAYAENPPKKYQDIYPINFDQDFDGLVIETLRLLRHWMGHGVRIFRVDNPHTKPVHFWEKVIGEINRTDPDVIFLAEAFTRPAMMHTLAKIGFQQSYTYFTWRNSKHELTEYLTELSGPAAAYMRPNFFANTPDILPRHLQHQGPAAFAVRAVLAATLSPSYGVYAGFELAESAPARPTAPAGPAAPAGPDTEEYLDSEKYQLRPRDWARTDTLAPLLTTLNRLRREHPALRELRNLTFLPTDNEQVIAYAKRTGDDQVILVVNLDPHQPQEATVTLPSDERLNVADELTGEDYTWHRHNYVRLDPSTAPAHLLTVRRTSL